MTPAQSAQNTRSPVHARITGTWLKKGTVSLNKNYYPAETVDAVVRDANAQISAKGSMPITMMVRHADADTDDSLAVVGRITRVWTDGDLARYEAEIANTSKGRELATLVQGGFISGNSLRSEPRSAVVEQGRVAGETVNIVKGFRLGGIDCTLTPGIRQDARMESVTVFESDAGTRRTAISLEESFYERPTLIVAGQHPRVAARNAARARYARHWYTMVSEAVAAGMVPYFHLEETIQQWLPILEKRFAEPGHATQRDRSQMDPKDFAGPHHTYPIETQQDVEDAAGLAGHAQNPDEVRAGIREIAARKGLALPKVWRGEGEAKESDGSAQFDDPGGGQAAPRPTLDLQGRPEGMPTDHEPCSACQQGDEEDCDCDGCSSGAGCYCCAVLKGVSGGAPPPTESHKETEMTKEEIQALIAESLAAARTDAAAPTTAPPTLEQVLESLTAVLAGVREAGRAISAGNQSKLAQAHDHIATVLGMECSSGGPAGVATNTNQPDASGKIPPGDASYSGPKGAAGTQQPGYSTGESANALGVAQIMEAVGKIYADANRAQAAATATMVSGATELKPYVPTPDPAITQMASAMTAIAEAVAATQEQLKTLAESIPAKAAAEAAAAAEQALWRHPAPGRTTSVQENTDAAPGADELSVLDAKLKDKSIDIKKRMHMALEAVGPAFSADVQTGAPIL